MNTHINTYPTIFKAFELICQDNDVPRPYKDFEMPFHIQEAFSPTFLLCVETFLFELSEEQLEALCIGDGDEQYKIYSSKPDGKLADKVLCEFFNTFIG